MPKLDLGSVGGDTKRDLCRKEKKDVSSYIMLCHSIKEGSTQRKSNLIDIL